MLFGTGNESTLAERFRIAYDGGIGINYAGTPTTETVHICNGTSGEVAKLSLTESHSGNRYGGTIGNIGDTGQGLTFSGLFNSNVDELMRLGDTNEYPRLKIGCTSQPSTSVGGIEISGRNGDNYVRIGCHQTSAYNIQYFYTGDGGAGYIQTSGTSTTYSTSSDYRLKENDVVISDGITRVKQLRPIRFNWKHTPGVFQDGFFAHEAQAVVPEAVSGTKDEMDMTDDTKIWPQGIDHGKIVPLLTAALKEAIAKIETLETKVAALESS